MHNIVIQEFFAATSVSTLCEACSRRVRRKISNLMRVMMISWRYLLKTCPELVTCHVCPLGLEQRPVSGHRTAGEESGKIEKFDKLIQTMGH